jgi:hypothetical protein
MKSKHTTYTLLARVADVMSYRKCDYSPVNSAMSPQSAIASPDSSLVSLIDTVPSEYSSDYCTVPEYQPCSQTSIYGKIFTQYVTTWPSVLTAVVTLVQCTYLPHVYPASSVTNLESRTLISMFKTKRLQQCGQMV